MSLHVAQLAVEDEESLARAHIEGETLRWFSRIVVEERLLHGQDAFPPGRLSPRRPHQQPQSSHHHTQQIPHQHLQNGVIRSVSPPSPRSAGRHYAAGGGGIVAVLGSVLSSCISPSQEDPMWPHGQVTSRMGVSPSGSDDDFHPLRGATSPTAREVEVSDSWISPPGATQPHSTTFRTSMYSWPTESNRVKLSVEAVYRHLDSVVTDEAFSRTLIESDHRWYLRQMFMDMVQGLQKQFSWVLGGAYLATRPFVTMQQAWRKMDVDTQLRHLPPRMRLGPSSSTPIGRRAVVDGPPISELDAAIDVIKAIAHPSAAELEENGAGNVSTMGPAGGSPLASIGYSTPIRPATAASLTSSYYSGGSPPPAAGCGVHGLASIVKDLVAKPPRLSSAASSRSGRTLVGGQW